MATGFSLSQTIQDRPKVFLILELSKLFLINRDDKILNNSKAEKLSLLIFIIE